MLSSSRGQANFRGLEASRPRPRTWPSRPRPRTSKCVLEDSTSDWNNRRSRRVFFRFYSAIFKLMSARFQAFAYNSRTIWSSYMKFWQQFETIDLHVRIKFWCNWLRDFCFRHRPVGRAVMRSSLEREVRGSNLGPVKSDTVLPTARHRCNISSKGAVLPGRNDAEMGPANSLHASAYYSEYKWKIWDLI